MSNRLALEDSPYLQQHKDNPVDWYPWGDEAFEKAKSEHKAIFISIGYSSCHWCHVMEHEVFENESIAAYLNAHFVSIKVDREERPDIDKHYQEVHMLLNRRPGGWPTSIFSTPENKAFYAGTYIPPEPRDKMIGFLQLIEIIAPKIAENDAKLFENADEIQSYLKPKEHPTQATQLSASIAESFIKSVKHNFEPTYGGFSIAPKFPHTSTLTTMMSIYQLNPHEEIKSEEIKSMVTHTLDNMAAGGIYDLVDGGFCRYSVDTEWLVPHFEKMTYDNGLLSEVYLNAYKIFGSPRYLEIARDIVSFMQKFMMENNLFYSASDADSEAEEGKYFVYTRSEVFEAIKNSGYEEDEAKKMTMRLCVSSDGNFEGYNIIRFADLQKPEWFERVRGALQAIRHPRPYPFIDKKVQTSWNAMMIKSLFELAKYDASILDQAVRSLDTLMEKMVFNNRLMHSALIHKEAKIEAFLEDYAYLGVALISAYELTCNESYLIKAQQMANSALENYYEQGRWYFSRGEFTTEADMGDNSYPGSIGVIVDLLLSLGSLVDEKYRRFAFKSLEYYSYELFKKAIYYPYLSNQALRYIHEDHICKVPLNTPISEIIQNHSYPYIRIQYHHEKNFMLCNNHSCFANASSLKELFKM
jgi:hypothetical protein